jgi:SAM-dependent methyltransferase
MTLQEPTTILFLEQTAKIVTTGRRTRLPHIVRVRFVSLQGCFYVLAGSRNSDWVSNALTRKNAKFRLQEFVWNVIPKITGPKELEVVRDAFAQKYGRRVVLDWYKDSPVCVQFTPIGKPAKRAAVKGEGEATTTLREWQTRNVDYYKGISEAFDSAAEEYDFTISNNYINTWIRNRSIRELLRLCRPDDVLVEIGCGTGAEAVLISRSVSKIIATDISEQMINLLTTKVRAKGLAGRIVPVLAKASTISEVAEILGGEKPRIAYSFNGALNCEPDLTRFVDNLHTLLADGGYFVCTIRNSLCFSEAISHAAVLQFDRMAPRKEQPIMVSVGGLDIPSVYYSPSAFEKYFTPKFKLERLIGLPALLPPAYLSDYYVKFKRVTSLVERAENVLSSHFPLNRLGDQSLYVFRKV